MCSRPSHERVFFTESHVTFDRTAPLLSSPQTNLQIQRVIRMIWRYFLSVEMSAAAGFNDSVGLAVGRSTSSWYRMVGRVCALHDSVTNDRAGHTGKNMHWRSGRHEATSLLASRSNHTYLIMFASQTSQPMFKNYISLMQHCTKDLRISAQISRIQGFWAARLTY